MQRQRFEYLLAKELSDELSVEETTEFASLLENNEELNAEYQLLQQYWNRKETHSVRDELLFKKVLNRIEVPVPQQMARRQLPLRQLAAAVALLLLASVAWFYWLSPTREQVLSTVHQQRSFILEDGTEVVLNAASSLKYPKTFDSLTREVELVGEAFFKVANDHKRPFIVHTQHAKLKVLGTSFNLRAYPDEYKTETSLIEGALEVSLNNKVAQAVRLKPSEKLVIYNGIDKKKTWGSAGKEIRRSKISFFHPKDTMAIETSWLNNKLVFKDTPFAELARTLERKYGVAFEFQGSKAPTLRFNAVFEQENIDQILTALKMASNFSYQVTSDKIVIYD